MPRTSLQNNAIKVQRSKEILDTSLKLFSEKGFEKVSIDMIADECHISHGLFYHYYSSKNEILENINNSFVEELEAMFTKLYREGEEGEIYLKKILGSLIRLIKSSKQKTFHAHLFLNTCLRELNLDENYSPFSKKVDDLLNKSIKIVKKDTTNLSPKEFNQVITYLLLLLDAYTSAILNYPYLLKDEPKIETIINFINYGLKGSASFDIDEN